MRLPECVDLGGEPISGGGFCPTAFLVPYDPMRGLTGQFGFVSGCVWGDDSSWKIQHLDLREAAKGILRRDDRFGYLELPRHVKLRNAVNLEFYRGGDEYGSIEFTVGRTFLMREGRFERDGNGGWIDNEEDADVANEKDEPNVTPQAS